MSPCEQKRTFRAVIENAGGGGAFVKVPFDVEEVFGKKRVKVKALIEGEQYRGSLVRMGGPDHILGILKSIREKIGKDFGDEVEVTVGEDTEERVVVVPPDLAQALKADRAATALFQQLSYSHQKEYVRWIEEAKRPETREARIEKTLAMLGQGKKAH
jgi:bifunctional DNA-binding transcriptional regulator/antitoxin component of YhaV-PrlF toxin-antitoxin module